jgi:cyanate permease
MRGVLTFCVGMLLGISCGFIFLQNTNAIIFAFVLGIGIGLVLTIKK